MKYYYLKRHRGIFYYLQHGQKKYGYRYYYRDQLQKRHERSRRGFATLRSAMNGYQLVQDPAEHHETVGQWCRYFLSRIVKPNVGTRPQDFAISTYTSYRNILDHSILPYLGKISLHRLTPGLYSHKCLSRLAQRQMSHKSILDINTCFKTVLNYAVQNGLLKRSPLMEIHPSAGKPQQERKTMSKIQLAKFNRVLARQNLTDRVIFETLERTGMRAGELLGLRWQDLDFSNHVIEIKHTRDNNGIRPPKTQSSRRNIPVDLNKMHLLKSNYRCCQKKYNVNRKAYVVLSSRGHPLTPGSVPKRLRRILAKCGFYDLIGRFVCHSFRHQFISELLSSGYDVVDVSKYVGHSNPDTTLKFYARALPGKLKNFGSAIQKINSKS